MSFPHRELDRLTRLMNMRQEPEIYARLRIAKETIEWMLDPTKKVAPSDGIPIPIRRLDRYALSDPNHGR